MKGRGKDPKMGGSRNSKTGIRIKNKRKKRGRTGMGARRGLLIAYLLILFMASSIGYVWCNFEKTQIGYDLSQLKKEELRLKDLNLKLRLELATLKSTKRLETLAVQKLGLRKPSPDQIITLP